MDNKKLINGAIVFAATLIGCVSMYYKSDSAMTDIAECVLEGTIDSALDLPQGTTGSVFKYSGIDKISQ